MKPFVRLRLRGLPSCTTSSSAATDGPPVCGISSAHAGRLLTLRGTIARVGSVTMWEERRFYHCNRCKRRHGFSVSAAVCSAAFAVVSFSCLAVPPQCQHMSMLVLGGSCFATADLEAGNGFTAPLACPVPSCTGSKLQPVGGPPILGDWQECRLQEPAGQLALNSKPASVALILTNDLTESCLPGGAHGTCPNLEASMCLPSPMAIRIDAQRAAIWTRLRQGRNWCSRSAFLRLWQNFCCADDVEVTGAVVHLWGRDVPGARCDCRLAVIALHVSVVSLRKAAVEVRRWPVKTLRECPTCGP